MGKRTKIISIVLASIFVVAGLATGGYFLFFRKKTVSVMNNTYALTSAKQENGTYPNTSFRDDEYYYYIWYLGKIKTVPLEDAKGNIFSYQGNDYTITRKSTILTAESVSKTISNASSRCLENFTSVEGKIGVNVQIGDDKLPLLKKLVKVNIDASLTATKSDKTSTSESVEQSITNVVNYTKEETSELKISFNSSYKIGSYRYVLFGNLEVYTVLIYDPATQEYSCKNIEKVANVIGYGLEYSEDGTFEKDHYDKFDFKLPSISEIVKNVPTEYRNLNQDSSENDIITVTPDIIENGTKNEPYLISSVNDFTEKLKNDGANVYFKLTADIDFGSTNSSYVPLSEFKGILDGDNHTISNISHVIEQSDSGDLYRYGMFRTLSGTVKNVKFNNLKVFVYKYRDGLTNLNVGGICGTLEGGTIDNCHINSAEVHGDHYREVKDGNAVKSQVGGFVGVMLSGTINNCSIKNGSVYGKAGCGNHNGDCHANIGGIVGEQNGGNITNCSRADGVTITSVTRGNTATYWFKDGHLYCRVGGIAGYQGSKATITRCNSTENNLTTKIDIDSGWCGDRHYHNKGAICGKQEGTVTN